MRKTEGIVLRRQEVRETSLTLILYTREMGKILGLIKGVRGLRAVVPWYLEPFSLQSIVVYERRRSPWVLVSGCDLLEPFDRIRRDLNRTATAAYCVDLVDAMTELNDPHPEIFRLLLNVLKELETADPAGMLAPVLEARLLKASGHLPEVKSLILAPEAKSVLQQMLTVPEGRIASLRLSAEAEAALRRMLTGLCRRVLERDLKSRRFLRAAGLERVMAHEQIPIVQ